jgi:FAD/FMN-containing dehydrogenase
VFKNVFLWTCHALRGVLTYGTDQDGSCEAQDLGVTKNNAEVLFDDNYPKMREIKKKYDPENIFANWFAITPAP